MKGYKPNLECKCEFETAGKQGGIIELGAVQKQCNCEDGVCKKGDKE